MAVTESDIMYKVEVGSPLQSGQKPEDHAFPSLGQQSSIYSLTLDEFQHTLCESGKNFGSMNMDEFLNSIWTAEENQAQAQATNNSSNPTATAAATNTNHTNNLQLLPGEASTDMGIAKQPNLTRQGSLTLPVPLCLKKVDEVWSEIHKSSRLEQQQSSGNNNNVQNPSSTQQQPTLGEMTLEDFLVRAGVVREQGNLPLPEQQRLFRLYQNNNPEVGTSFISRPVMGLGTGSGSGGRGGSGDNVPTYQTLPQGVVGGGGESSGYAENGKNGGYPLPPPVKCYGGREGNVGGGVGYGLVQGLGMGTGSPVSPVSSDKMFTDGKNQYGLDMSGVRGGRKRILDGSVEKGVERRQRRMIKNRESAARSRARKQAYTIELEAELNQLKEENAQLKQALGGLEMKIKQQYFEEAKFEVQTMAQKAEEKMQVMWRSLSCPL